MLEYEKLLDSAIHTNQVVVHEVLQWPAKILGPAIRVRLDRIPSQVRLLVCFYLVK